MSDRPNIYASDAAREAAAIEIAKFVLDDAGIHDLIASDPSGTIHDATNRAIDAFLAKSLEGADEKLAEIRGRAREDDAELRIPTPSPPDMDFKRWVVASADRETLLTLVTALSAKLKEQKAAHAKMLRDEAEKADDLEISARALNRLADKIEGGD